MKLVNLKDKGFKVKALLEEGDDLDKHGHYEQAIKVFKKVIEINPIELRVINTGSTNTNWVRVALIQINFNLIFNKPPDEFGYRLLNKELIKSKVFKALELASKNKANIICFPELSVEEGWIDEAKNLYKDNIIIFGSFYKTAFNTCPILIQGQVYNIQKIFPSPHDEGDIGTGRCMKSGREIIIYQTKFGRIAVLICLDFIRAVHEIVNNLDDEKNSVDFIIVPSRNRAVDSFQKRGDLVCQEDHLPYVLQVNSAMIDKENTGGTCIIGIDHNGALQRYKMENLKPDDNIKYKLFEAAGEAIIIADLDISRKGAPVPAADFKMKNPVTLKID